MPPAFFETLVRHHAWAGQRLLDTAALLTPAQLETGSLSQGSLFATLRHVADVNQSWGRTAQGLPELSAEQVEHDLVDLASLRDFWFAEDARLLAFTRSLTPADLEREVHRLSKTRTYKIGWILFHITNHRMDHGNEIGWDLTRLGHSPGEMGFMAFLDLERVDPTS
jgi:uncharacterized damage-inducible protein DinB